MNINWDLWSLAMNAKKCVTRTTRRVSFMINIWEDKACFSSCDILVVKCQDGGEGKNNKVQKKAKFFNEWNWRTRNWPIDQTRLGSFSVLFMYEIPNFGSLCSFPFFLWHSSSMHWQLFGLVLQRGCTGEIAHFGRLADIYYVCTYWFIDSLGFFPLQVIRFGYFVVRDQAAQLPLGLPPLRQPQVKAKIPTTNYYAQRIFLLQTPGPEQEKQVQSKRIFISSGAREDRRSPSYVYRAKRDNVATRVYFRVPTT